MIRSDLPAEPARPHIRLADRAHGHVERGAQQGDGCHHDPLLEWQPSEIVQGVFELKYLTMFTKCTNLCPSIELYLKNDYPLVLRYMVANLGEIRLVLARHKQKA